jgi:hypothetical protein
MSWGKMRVLGGMVLQKYVDTLAGSSMVFWCMLARYGW